MGSVVGIATIGIVFGSIVAIMAIISWTVVRLLGKSGQSHDDIENESQLMQELYHGLNKLEERIESLETILLDREKPGSGS
jgi:phage shock protein B